MAEQERKADSGQVSNGNGIINPQRVSRRSMRSGSEFRHGRVYDEDMVDTARAVTPESNTYIITSGGTNAETLSMSPTQMTSHQSPFSMPNQDHSASVSNTDEEGASEVRSQRLKKKSRSRDDNPLESSPGSFISKTRKRLGSITSVAGVSGWADEASSQGGPLLQVAPSAFSNLADVRNSLPRTPRRTISADTAVRLSTLSSVRSPSLTNTDFDKILSLMKTTCGRMHGILFFRPIGASAWDSGYCAINVTPGSLVSQRQGELKATKTLLPDLRGCSVRTNYDAESQSVFISVVLPLSGTGYQLRPPVPETFDSWLAALLCWQPVRPKGVHDNMMKSPAVKVTEKRPVGQRRLSDMAGPKSTAIVKIGNMLLLDSPLPAGSQRRLFRRPANFDDPAQTTPWKRVSCVLHENGTFKLLSDVDQRPVQILDLSRLARCAIQRLDTSVLDTPHCLAIYPQFTLDASVTGSSKPLVACVDGKSAYEAWYVVLRSLTAPELYGPERDEQGDLHIGAPKNTDISHSMFRIERTLAVKITEAKLHRDPASDLSPGVRTKGAQRNVGAIDVYADVMLGRDLRARTTQRNCSTSAFWAEEFFIPDLPPILSTVSVAVKIGNPSEQEWSMVSYEPYDLPSTEEGRISRLNDIEVAAHDPDYGKVGIQIDELERERAIEKWWQLHNRHGRVVGSILMRLSLSETIVLMEAEYAGLSALLHTFENGLTSQMGQVLSQDLKLLSEILLDIFQASNTAHEWINALVEDEIDGIYKETPPVRMRFSGRIHSNDSYESAEQREVLVRDLSRSATMEANLLFRGNSLVTKALDTHMRRLGKQYLESTIGERVRFIYETNPDCEVDPSKVQSSEQLDRNWMTLKNLTRSVWKAISISASQCPPALRLVFKHIRSCAEDRYGSFIRTVKYTSVSGFLFLRFFCPAILNPKLFELIEAHPQDRARRTFTLVAKSLNVLASMAKFGTKETWMEPMNRFLQSATTEFKWFIDEMCSIDSSTPADVLEPQFVAPMQIRPRLSPLAREGLPVLPFLLDAPRCLAALVDLWAEHAPAHIAETDTDDAMKHFHRLCNELHGKARECIRKAEPAEKPDRNLEPKWQQMLSEQQQKQAIASNPFEQGIRGLSVDSEITALPQRSEPRRTPAIVLENGRGNVTLSTGGRDGRRLASAPPAPTFVSSTNSSTASFDHYDDGRKHVGSREGLSKARIFDLLSSARKRNRADKITIDHNGSTT